MTRINVVPVELLSDKHLLAEYKEITRPFNKVAKRIANNTMKDVEIPKQYCLGKGHETFFFDKLKWLYVRYINLGSELRSRGFKLDEALRYEISNDLLDKFHSTVYWKMWKPSHEDIYLNMARLVKRSNMPRVLDELAVKEDS